MTRPHGLELVVDFFEDVGVGVDVSDDITSAPVDIVVTSTDLTLKTITDWARIKMRTYKRMTRPSLVSKEGLFKVVQYEVLKRGRLHCSSLLAFPSESKRLLGSLKKSSCFAR